MNRDINNIIKKYLTYTIESLSKFNGERKPLYKILHVKKNIDLLDIFIKLLQNRYNAISIPYNYSSINDDMLNYINDLEEKYGLEIKRTWKYDNDVNHFVYYIDIYGDNRFFSCDIFTLDIIEFDYVI